MSYKNRNEIDPRKTLKVWDLLSMPANQRDLAWTESFFENVSGVLLAPHPSKVILGPDSCSYRTALLAPIEDLTQARPFSVVADHCLKSGYGLVICSDARGSSAPLWVFSFGDLWCFKEHNSFWGDPRDIQELQAIEQLDADQIYKLKQQPPKYLLGDEAENVFPKYAREAIGRFLAQIGLKDSSFAVVEIPGAAPSRSISIHLKADPINKSMKSEPPKKHPLFSTEDFEHVLYYLKWYFPRNKSVVLKPDEISSQNWQKIFKAA